MDIAIDEPASEPAPAPAPQEDELEYVEMAEAPTVEPQPEFDAADLSLGGGEISPKFLEEEQPLVAEAEPAFDLGEEPKAPPPARSCPPCVRSPRRRRPRRSTACRPTCAARSRRSSSTSRWASSRTRAACSRRWGRGSPSIPLSSSGSPSWASSSRRHRRWTSCSARRRRRPWRRSRARTSRCSSARASSSSLRRRPCPRPPPPAPAPISPAGDGEGFDLASELGGLFGAQAAVAEEPAPAVSGTDLGDASLSDIFREFQKGVDKQLGKEDYETRYNLGIAYKEMGLVDEAIAEFQLAAKDEKRLLECSSMLGICFIEKGMPKLAVKWFEKGLQAPNRSEDEYQGLRYDLGTAYEAAGETAKALSIFEELYGQDASFRDVAEKVRKLRG
jgi:hypothetical protein